MKVDCGNVKNLLLLFGVL